MFKYKSPLSRLLEGAGKPKEEETEVEVVAEETAEPETEKPQPIADFNALRNALAGGNMSSESYEEADELIPEKDMPEFSDEPEEDASEDVVVTEVVEEAEDNIFETPETQPEPEEPVVTLHIATDEEGEAEETAQTEEPQEEAIPEVVVETLETAQPEPFEPAQPEPVAEIAPEPEITNEPPQPVQTPATEDRRGRVKTTFLGFERADTHVQEMIESADPVAKTETAQETFPVGWLVVTAGPGRGSCVTLTEGLMQIGRNDDQAIQLDFGDTGISRSNHAVIAYDPEDRKCYLGHGGKANLVRLNGKPVLSTVALSSGDLIRISETSIRFAAFCDDGFDWRDA
ncbi:FHA domain-containing protein [Ruegeria sp. ANG10]|uniref:FHA domain-containing protein n=1 Tax=Ruegeria sp. ANG10 TaxID=3042467 RepID=UPI003453DD82